MRNPDLILAGSMGAGKTWAADYLVEHHGYTKMSLATPVKDLAGLILGRPIQKGTDRDFLQALGKAGRSPLWAIIDEAAGIKSKRLAAVAALVQNLRGIPKDADDHEVFWAAVRSLEVALYDSSPMLASGFGSVDYWTGVLIEKLAAGTETERTPIVIDDCRFPNEAALLVRQGFKVVLVDTPLPECCKRVAHRDGAFKTDWLADESEQAWKSIRYDEAISGVKDVGWELAGLLSRLSGLADAA